MGFGSSGPFSQVVNLADVPAPPAMTNVSGPQADTSAAIEPVDTGIDQAPLSVEVLDNNSSSNPLPIDDPSYQWIYYRARLAGER